MIGPVCIKFARFPSFAGLLLGVVVICAGAGGCAKWPPAIRASLDPSLSQEVVHVDLDLVAVDAQEFDRWNGMPVSQYWSASPSSLSRTANAYRKRIRLSKTQREQVIPSNDPIWAKWNERVGGYLFVIAGLSALPDASPDPRRQWISLDRENKKYPPEITVRVTRNGVSISPLPEDQRPMFGAAPSRDAQPPAG
jgi:hypothetical protein